MEIHHIGSENRIKDLERQLQDLREQWPAHSVPARMVQRLDELEEEIEKLRTHPEQLDA